jgi:hypothetical protein
MVWIIPAGIAFVVFFTFALFDDKKENRSNDVVTDN